MAIDIHIHINLTERQKRVMRIAVVGGTLIAALGIGVAIAMPIDTTWIQSGAPVSASSLSTNLNGLQSQITTLQANLTAFEAQIAHDGGYAVGATYCGLTSMTNGSFSTSSGGVVGYVAAKMLCAAACGNNPAAHMCSGDELIRTVQLGGTTPVGGWYSSGVVAFNPNSAPQADCSGWTANSGVGSSGAGYGTYWKPLTNGGTPAFDPCQSSAPILCCD